MLLRGLLLLGFILAVTNGQVDNAAELFENGLGNFLEEVQSVEVQEEGIDQLGEGVLDSLYESMLGLWQLFELMSEDDQTQNWGTEDILDSISVDLQNALGKIQEDANIESWEHYKVTFPRYIYPGSSVSFMMEVFDTSPFSINVQSKISALRPYPLNKDNKVVNPGEKMEIYVGEVPNDYTWPGVFKISYKVTNNDDPSDEFVLSGFSQNLRFLSIEDQPSYSAYLPKFVRPAQSVSYLMEVFEAFPVTLRVESELVSTRESNPLKMVSTDYFKPGDSKRINLGEFPRFWEGGFDDFKLSFKAYVEGQDVYQVVFQDSTKDIEFSSKAMTILIQTDKAIYKPGQSMKFRGVYLQPDLRPVDLSKWDETASFEILDPSGNLIFTKSSQQLEYGVMSGEFELHPRCQEGDWTISFKVYDEPDGNIMEESITFEVTNYKLPKFEVEIEAPNFLHPGTEQLDIVVRAKYTYGKPVKGSGSVVVSMRNEYVYWWGPRQEKSMKFDFKNFDGEEEFKITRRELYSLGWTSSYSTMKVSINAYVTEDLTDIRFSKKIELPIVRSHIKTEAIFNPKTMKPGLTYSAYIQVTEYDGSPLQESDRLNNNLIVELDYRFPYEEIEIVEDDFGFFSPWRSTSWNYRRPENLKKTFNFSIPENGIVQFETNVIEKEFEDASFRVFTDATKDMKYVRDVTDSWTASPAVSPSGSFLQITSTQSSYNPGDTADLQILCTAAAEVDSIGVMYWSRSQMHGTGQATKVESDDGKQSFAFSFPITNEMVPSVQIVVYFMTEDGEIVADTAKFSVSLSLDNKVNINTNADTFDAGDDVSIRVETSAKDQSYVGIRAIDQSVLLLKAGNDFSTDKISQDLNGYSTPDSFDNEWNNWWWWWPTPSEAVDTKEVFEDADITVLTDALVYEKEEEFGYKYSYGRIAGGAQIMALGAVDMVAESADMVSTKTLGAPAPSKKGSEGPRLRKKFPESWLWENTQSSDGVAYFNTTVPDTITSWVLSAFSVSEQAGFGLADTSKITVFRPFFVNLNLPLKVTRGEVVIVQANIFNYMSDGVQVQVTLQRNSKFTLIEPGQYTGLTDEEQGYQREIFVPADDSVSVSFPVMMNQLGQVPFKVSAVSNVAGDALVRNIFVQPEGIPQCYSASALIIKDDETSEQAVEYLNVTIPKGAVDGSAAVDLYVYGDVMGSTMNNLGDLMKEPYGCGEQNMVTFAPDVFISMYLNSTDQLSGELKEKSYNHFIKGYQNQLNYKRKDGSFSAFGDRDKFGSTWLTAFVVKCFAHAAQLQPEMYSAVKDSIRDAGQYLIDMQRKEGNFKEVGKVSHKALQGGVNSDLTMAAYVLISLIETDVFFELEMEDSSELEIAFEFGRQYIEERLDEPMTVYARSLITYALFVLGSERAQESLVALNSFATLSDDGSMLYWEELGAEPDASKLDERWEIPYKQAASRNVEMTSYALLSYSFIGDKMTAVPIMKWIASQRNSNGGWSDTQSTVIATQALSDAATMLNEIEQNLSLKFSHNDDEEFDSVVQLTEENKLLFNRLNNIPQKNGRFAISNVEGTGVAAVQLSVCYNVPDNLYEDESFDCKLKVLESEQDSAVVQYCCSLKENDDKSTGMFVFDFNIPSGFSVMLDNEKQRNRFAKMVEQDEDSINIYYDQLTPKFQQCGIVQWVRTGKVGAVKGVTVTARDYYNPERRNTMFYSIPAFEKAGVCEICGSKCAGCPKPSLTDWTEITSCKMHCGQENSVWVRECFDPNTKKNTSPQVCGVDELPKEERPCRSASLPQCPDFHSSLWTYAPNSRFKASTIMCTPRKDTYAFTSYRYAPWNNMGDIIYRAPPSLDYENGGYDGVPATSLGDHNDYFSCDLKQLRMDISDGFTLSFLLNLNDDMKDKKFTLFSYGERNRAPIAFMGSIGFDSFGCYVNGDGYNKETTFDVNELFGGWKHVVVTHSRDDGVKIYINGESVEQKQRNGMSSLRRSSWKYANFYIGVQFTNPAKNKGPYYKPVEGWFSSLDVWKFEMSSEQASTVYNFFDESMLNDKNEDDVIQPSMWYHYVPAKMRSCFNDPISLKQLYENVASENKFWCKSSLSAGGARLLPIPEIPTIDILVPEIEIGQPWGGPGFF